MIFPDLKRYIPTVTRYRMVTRHGGQKVASVNPAHVQCNRLLSLLSLLWRNIIVIPSVNFAHIVEIISRVLRFARKNRPHFNRLKPVLGFEQHSRSGSFPT
jgi:hypothetical protein